jgi:cyclohexanone monooxygenase
MGETVDVLIVGAGLSGIGAARRLQRACPDKRFLILEARATLGGTWDLFRYPGIRSDSDMHTLGYDFKPWTQAKAIADGPAILRYVREAAEEAGIERHIRYGHRVRAARWSSLDARWRVEAERSADGSRVVLEARFLHLCSGYYSYARGHRPVFAGEADFTGRIVEPQFWPSDLDYAGRRVVVVGSGATAMTLVPEMAKTAAGVTMLQRSPSYVVARPSEDRIAQWLSRRLPARWAYGLTRWKNVLVSMFYYRMARRRPEAVRRRLIDMVRAQVGPGCDVARHFTPRYMPWDQRVCLVPDGDLFRQIRAGRVAVVTESIERFCARGVRLASGALLPADVIVLATGLELNVLGDIALQIDGRDCEPGRCLAYKGMMLSGVPNLAMTFGYTNASWTLKADLTAGYVCRLLRYLDRHGYASATPRADPGAAALPFLTFTSGYVQRALASLPKQGARAPWRVYQNYLQDLLAVRFGRVADGVLQFQRLAQDRA